MLQNIFLEQEHLESLDFSKHPPWEKVAYSYAVIEECLQPSLEKIMTDHQHQNPKDDLY